MSIYPVYQECDGHWLGWHPRAPDEVYEGKTLAEVKKQLPIVRLRAGAAATRSADGRWSAHIVEIEEVSATGSTEASARKAAYAALMKRVREDGEIAAKFFRLRDDPPDSWEVELIPRSQFRARIAEELRKGGPMHVESGMTTPEGWVATEGRWGADSDVVRSAEAFLKANATSPPEPDVS